MLDFSITFALLPKYWKVGVASITSDDIDEDYYVQSYTLWLILIGLTLTISTEKDEN